MPRKGEFKTHCKWGHALTPENRLKSGACRECSKNRVDKWVLAHPERNQEHKTKYSVNNKKEIATKSRERRKKHPDAILDTKLRYRYNLPLEKYRAMLVSQGNKCAICPREFTDELRPHVDHDHACCPGERSCGKCIRGLLCYMCNHGLGSFRDDREILTNAIQYLKETQCKTQQKPTSYVFSPIGPIHTGSGKSSAIGSLFLKAAAMA